MEKRVFLAIFLSFVVLGLYQLLFAPPPLTPPAGPVEAGAPATAAQAPGATPPTPTIQQAAPSGATPLIGDAVARDIVVETEAIRAVFNTKGATLRSWQLKHYRERDGTPLELVPSLGSGFDYPFTLATSDATLSATLAAALFKPSAESLSLGTATGTISFQYSDAAGLNARKTFVFQPDGKPYIVNVEAAIDVQGTSLPVTLKFGPALHIGNDVGGPTHLPATALISRSGKVDRLSASALASEPRFEGQPKFVGVDEQYFLVATLPGSQAIKADFQPITVPGTDPAATPRTFIAYSVGTPGPGAASLAWFIGPKEFDILRAVDGEFVRAIDFGMFAWLVVPMLQGLKWLYGYIGNYGWSIVVLTILINLVLFPLRHRSMVSMRKMQSLQPEIKAIQDRYAKYKLTDPERQKMNTEMMALYKQKGVNPASGCVPMLLTMPILFAFYAMLQVAIELRGAPFFGWIHDLSLQDPTYIWPLLMGGTMFWQQKLMPASTDPTQAKILMLMPIVFTVSFLWFPSGLVIYWLTSNLMAIAQQYLTNRIIGAPTVARVVRTSGPPKPNRTGAGQAGKP
ncbi:MAG TPA: membrane protein insertase YidC [Vicinamibacterales bacterium]|nr:membrane protein insertase YidC [Vicinamibacterales bacterium]